MTNPNKIIFIAIPLAAMAALTGCMAEKNAVDTASAADTTIINNESTEASYESESESITETQAVLSRDGDGWRIALGGDELTFTGDYPEQPNFEPRVVTADFTDDGNPDAAVIFTTGYGTGIHGEEIRIFDIFHQKELKTSFSILEYVKNMVTVKDNGDCFDISFLDSILTINKSDYAGYGEVYSPVFGTLTYYGCDGENLYCDLSILVAGPMTGYADTSVRVYYTYERGHIYFSNIIFVNGLPDESVNIAAALTQPEYKESYRLTSISGLPPKNSV